MQIYYRPSTLPQSDSPPAVTHSDEEDQAELSHKMKKSAKWIQIYYKITRDYPFLKNPLLVKGSLAFIALLILYFFIIYWPYMSMYWIRPQWARVQYGWKSFTGDEEHLQMQHEMEAKAEYNKRQLLRSHDICKFIKSANPKVLIPPPPSRKRVIKCRCTKDHHSDHMHSVSSADCH